MLSWDPLGGTSLKGRGSRSPSCINGGASVLRGNRGGRSGRLCHPGRPPRERWVPAAQGRHVSISGLRGGDGGGTRLTLSRDLNHMSKEAKNPG